MDKNKQKLIEREKLKQAVALSYDTDDAAPRVIAAGQGYLAERIIEKAVESDVPLHRDDQLAESLMKLQIGDMIPAELYEIVAEVLVFVDRMDNLKKKLGGKQNGEFKKNR